MKKWTLLLTMLVLVLGLGVTALAQEVPEEVTEETTTEETTTEDTATEETATEETATEEAATEETAPSSPEFTLGADGFSVDSTDSTGVTNIPCFSAFRDEQEELVATGTVPTSASDAARACEGFGIANPYPTPYFYDDAGFLYTYDPIEGIYNAPDPDNGVVYVYDPTSGTYSTYDSVNGTYL